MCKRLCVLIAVLLFATSGELNSRETISIDCPEKVQSDCTVQPLQTLTGKVSKSDAKVWIIVHPIDSAVFWVQPQASVTDKKWTGHARFGEAISAQNYKQFEVKAIANPAESLEEGMQKYEWPAADFSSQDLLVKRIAVN